MSEQLHVQLYMHIGLTSAFEIFHPKDFTKYFTYIAAPRNKRQFMPIYIIAHCLSLMFLLFVSTQHY